MHLPAFATTAIGPVASAASPVALFVIGGSLVGLRLDGQRTDIATVVIGKLILHPLAVLTALWLLPAIEATLSAAAVLFAEMPMLSIYPVLSQKYRLVGFGAAALPRCSPRQSARLRRLRCSSRCTGCRAGG